jgi:hypothetical protein
MADYKYFGSSGSVKIEVSGGGGGTSNAYAADFLSALQGVSEILAAHINQTPADHRPSEIQVGFGLTALNTGGFSISLGEETANFRVLLKWGGSQEGLLGGVEIPEEAPF